MKPEATEEFAEAKSEKPDKFIETSWLQEIVQMLIKERLLRENNKETYQQLNRVVADEL